MELEELVSSLSYELLWQKMFANSRYLKVLPRLTLSKQAALVSVVSGLTLHHAEHSQEGQQLGRNGRLVAVKRKDRRPETQH